MVAEPELTPVNAETMVRSIKEALSFQRKWQRLSCFAYVGSTIGILACSTGATIAASQSLSQVAAYLAAASTVLVGLEKSILFREKWKFHLGIATRLSVLLMKAQAEFIPLPKLIDEYTNVLTLYSENLPVAAPDSR